MAALLLGLAGAALVVIGTTGRVSVFSVDSLPQLVGIAIALLFAALAALTAKHYQWGYEVKADLAKLGSVPPPVAPPPSFRSL